MPWNWEEMLPTEDPLFAHHHAEETMKAIVPIDGPKMRESVVKRINWVMVTLSPIAEVRTMPFLLSLTKLTSTQLFPLAKMAHSLLSAIPKVCPFAPYSKQGAHVEDRHSCNSINMTTTSNPCSKAMHDAFDFAHHENALKSIKPQLEQARILTLMLQDVCSCCDFIQSYARDLQFCMLSSSAPLAFCKCSIFRERRLKNTGGGPENKIKDLSDALDKRRRAFLGQVIISTEITVFQILYDLGKLSSQTLDASRSFIMLSGFTDLIVVIELDAKIGEIPYGFSSRFSPDKGCLLGTCMAFLDFIVNRVNDPTRNKVSFFSFTIASSDTGWGIQVICQRWLSICAAFLDGHGNKCPHVYLSALPFVPACSLVSTHYSSSFPQILHVERGRLSHWPSC